MRADTFRTSGILLAAAMFASIGTPAFIPAPFAPLGIDQAFAAGNGNGNGNRNGHAKSNNDNRGNGNSNRSINSSSSNRGNSSNAQANQNANAGGGNLHARLGGLNSLNRNINGLMNSSDPRMTEVREFVQAGADLVDAQAALVIAQENVASAENTYLALVTSLGVSGYDDLSPTGLQLELDAINAALIENSTDPDLLAAQSTLINALNAINAGTEWSDLMAVAGQLDGATQLVGTLELATSDDTLLAALQSAANRNRTVGEEEFNWSKAQLEAALADYLAAQ